MTLAELVNTHRPECDWSCADWPSHADHLEALDPNYMLGLSIAMDVTGQWLRGPVVVDDGFVQDGHHRIVTAVCLGWLDRDVPVVAA